MSFMSWLRDLLIGVDNSVALAHGKAAARFKNAKQFDLAKMAYLKEAECYVENKDLFNAAKATEQAAMMMKEQKKMPEAIRYIEKACTMYMASGSLDTAALALERAGQLAEPTDLNKAVDLYLKAVDVHENNNRLYQAAELLGKASSLLVRLKRLDDAAVVLQREKNTYREVGNYPMCFKKTNAQVLVHLHRGDFVAADACVRDTYSLSGYSVSEDCLAMETLLQAFNEQNEEQVCLICNSALLKCMDNDYAKLAISLKAHDVGLC